MNFCRQVISVSISFLLKILINQLIRGKYMKRKRYLSYHIRQFLVQFLPHERGLSDNTILSYRDALKLLLRFCDQYLHLKVDELLCEQIDRETVLKFLDYLEQERDCTPKTRNSRLAALKTFFYYVGCEVPECLDNSQKIGSIAIKKVPHKNAEYLDTEEYKAILGSIEITSRNGKRDLALLRLMHNTGARVQEIVDIKLGDLRLDAVGQIILTGKGDKQRVCPLWKETVEAIQAYLAERKPRSKDENHLFLNAKGESITRFGIRYIVKKYTDKASKIQPSLKMKKVSPHTFRHTTAMHLLQAGNELNAVRLWLGHASLNTTHLYVEIDMEMKRKILNKSRPPELEHIEKKWKNPEILCWLDDICKPQVALV